MSEIMPWWGWFGVAVWALFGVVAVIMLPTKKTLPWPVRAALFVFHLLLIAPFGLFAFAIAMDAAE